MSNPSDKNAVEAKEWIELAKLAQENFHNRRSYEWKLAFGFWTAIGAFTSPFILDKIPKGANLESFKNQLHWFYIFIWLVTVVCWQIPLHSAHAGDREYKFYYIGRIKGMKEKQLPNDGLFKNWGTRNVLWCIGQCVISAVFLYMSWWLITQAK